MCSCLQKDNVTTVADGMTSFVGEQRRVNQYTIFRYLLGYFRTIYAMFPLRANKSPEVPNISPPLTDTWCSERFQGRLEQYCGLIRPLDADEDKVQQRDTALGLVAAPID